MAKRRTRGEGTITQRHDHPSCPPLIDGERADHRCQGRWMAQLNLGWAGKKRIRKTVYGATKAEVRVKLADAAKANKEQELVLSSPTVETWMRYWLDEICPERKLKVNTMKSHRSKVEQHIIPHLGRHRVDRLQPEHLRAMYKDMENRGLADATRRQTHMILRRALKVAVREKKAAYNVAELIDAPSADKEKRTGLAASEAERVAAIAGLRWWVAIYLGMRQGECLGLRWSDVHLTEKIPYLEIQRTLVRKPGEGLAFDTPKSRASRRLVPLPTFMAARFTVAWAEHLAAGGGPDELVFGVDGKPKDHRRDWQEWTDLLERAGVKHIALHAARNTTASLLERKGVPDRVVAQILGQSSVQVTHGYQSADLQFLLDALQALEADAPKDARTPAALPAAP